MLAYRQRGLVNLHAIVVGCVMTALLPIYAEFIRLYDVVTIESSVQLAPYILAVFFAMMSSTRAVRERAGSLHILGVTGALALAIRQLAYVAAALFFVAFIRKDLGVSRILIASYLMTSGVVLTVLHAKLPATLARILFPDRMKLPTIFVGSGKGLEDLDSWISARGHIGIRPVGFLSDDFHTRADGAVAPYLGRIEQLEAVMKERSVAQVILLDWFQSDETIEHLAETCEREGVRFLIHNNYAARFAREMTPIEEGGRHFLVIQTEPLEDPVNRAAKRTLDILVALPVVLLVIPPLCLLVGIMQRKQAPGPLFFNRPRGGQNRRPFKMFKFRSMFATDHDINVQAVAGDSRIFKFGRIMRKTSIDEFPQFINVLRGDMSIVGPRPHLPEHDTEFSRITRTYHGRAFVKPGITGLAQVRGYRGEITDPHKLHRRVYWDLYYVSRWSLGLDIRIICLTAWHLVSPPESAY